MYTLYCMYIVEVPLTYYITIKKMSIQDKGKNGRLKKKRLNQQMCLVL